MPSFGQILSSVVMTGIGMAVIFRVDFLRSAVTGLQVQEAGKSAPAGARMLYM